MSKQSLIEQLQDLCEKHGCPVGINRIWWLGNRLSKLASLERAQPAGEAVARLLTWNGPAHMPVPHGGVCARTFEEFPKVSGESHRGYWKEGTSLYAAPPAAANQAGTWISVDERLPERGQDVLVSGHQYNDPAKPRFVCSATKLDGGFFDDAGDGIFTTHWMPLPSAPHTKRGDGGVTGNGE